MSKIVKTPGFWEHWSGTCKTILLGAVALVSGAGAAGPHPADPKGLLTKYVMYAFNNLEIKTGESNTTSGDATKSPNAWIGAGNLLDANGTTFNAQIRTPKDLKLGGGSSYYRNFFKDTALIGGVLTMGAVAQDKLVKYNQLSGASAFMGSGPTVNANPNVLFPADTTTFVADPSGPSCTFNGSNWGGCSSTKILPPGKYGSLTLNWNSGEGILQAGEYHVTSITMNAQSSIRVDKQKSEVTRILMTGDINVVAGDSIVTTVAGDYGKVLIYSSSTGTSYFNDHTKIDASIYIPKGTAIFISDAKLNGQVIAKNIITNNNFNGSQGTFVPFDPENVSFAFANGGVIPEQGNPAVANGNVGQYSIAMNITPAITTGNVTIPFVLHQNRAVLVDGDATIGTDVWLQNGSNCQLPHVISASDSVGSVTFPANSTSQNIVFCVNNDNQVEGSLGSPGIETFKYVIDTNNLSFSRDLVVVNQLSYDLQIQDDQENRNPNAATLSNNSVNERSNFVGVITKSDPDSDPITLTLSDNTNFRISGDSLYLVNPAIYENADGTAGTRSYSLTITSTDNKSASTPASFTITVNNQNDELPLANTDTLNLSEGATATKNVLTNDRDPADNLTLTGTTLTLVNKSGVANALGGAQFATAVSLAADGTLSYTHNGSENFADTVYYVLNDNGIVPANQKDTGMVIINISPVNDNSPLINRQTGTINENATLSAALVATDVDLPNDVLTFTSNASTVNGGTFSITSTGTYTYVNKGKGTELNKDSVQITVTDAANHASSAWLVFNINLINDESPIARDSSYTLNEDDSVVVVAPGLFNLQSDLDGPAATLSLLQNVAHGNLTFNTNGAFTYKPNGNYNGSDLFTYIVNDGTFADTATIRFSVVPVNDIPVGTDKSYSINEDETLNVSAATGALSGATDADGDALTASKIVNVKNGTLTVNADGSMVYVPNLNFNGLDTAKVQIADGNGGLDTVQVVFTVVAVNDAPLGTDKTYSTNEDVTFNLAAIGVLSGATDVEGNAITVATKVVDVKHGALTANADGSVVYVPNANFFGADTARLQIADGQGGLDTIQVVINVNEVNDTATALGPKSNNLAENSVAGTLVARLTTTDAADALVPETFSYSLVDPANNDGVQFRISGDSLLVASGAVLNFESKSVLKLVVKSTDRGGNGIAIQDTITVNLTDVNETPVRTAHLADLNLQEEFADTTVADLSTKFSDPDAGDVISYTVSTSNSKLSANLSGTNLVLKSAKDSVGATLVYITATDKAGLKAYDTLTVNIANVNDNPVLNDSNYSITENSAIGTFVGKLNPYDVDVAMGLGDALTLTQLSNSKLFVIRGDSILSRAELDYEAVKSDTLMVEVSDKAGLKDTARVIVNINNVIEKSRLNITGVNSTSPTQNAWIALRDTVLGHVTITHGNSGVKGLDSLWTKDTSFVLHYTEDGRIVDSNLTLGSELSSKGYGTQIVKRIYQNPTKDLADTITFVIAYNTKIPTLAIDTTVKKFKKDSNGRIWVNDSIMKKDQGKFDWDISTVGSDPFVRVKIDSVVRAQLSEGENKLIVAYTDRYGNVGFDTVRVMVDTKYPLVRIDSPRGPKGEDTSKVFSLGVGVNWTVDGVKQTLDTIQGLVEGANVIVRGNCDYAGNCAYDTVWVDALFEDNRIKVQVKDAIIGLTNGKVISDDEQAQKEQEYYQERNQARGESEVIPTQEGYNLTLINTQTGKSEEIMYYNGSNQKKIDSNRRVGLDTNLSIGPRVKVTMQFPLIDDSVGSCKDGKPMWEFNVNAIDANIYDQIGQFVSSVHVPGFVVDKKAYQQSATDASPGTVDAFLELPKVRNDMRSINGQRWGDGVYLINIRVRTTAKGINCNEGKLNPASISTMTKVGYVRAK